MQREDKKKSIFKRLFEKANAKKADGDASKVETAFNSLKAAIILEDGTLADEETTVNAVNAFLETVSDIYENAAEQTEETKAEGDAASIAADDIRAIVEEVIDAKLADTKQKAEKSASNDTGNDMKDISEIIKSVVEEKIAPLNEAIEKAYNAKNPSNLNGSEQLNKSGQHYLTGIL